MKQTCTLLVFILIYSVGDAQVRKGDIMVGGNLQYYEQSQSTTPTSSVPADKGLNLDPSVGKAVKDNLVLGVDLGYNFYSSGDPDGTTVNYTTQHGGSLGVFVRRYRPIGAGFSLFGQAEVSGNYTHVQYTTSTSNFVVGHSNSYGLGLNLYGGVAYALNRRWQMEAGLPNLLAVNYVHSRETQQYTGLPATLSSQHGFDLSSSLSGNDVFTVGVRYVIGG